MSMEPVLHSFAYGLDFLREQVEDVAEADFVVQPNGIRNHPAWTIGHIVFARQSLGRAIWVSHWLPKDWKRHPHLNGVQATDRRRQMDEKPKRTFRLGDTVRILSGPFASFNGKIEGINQSKALLKVKVAIYGRNTPIRLTFTDVEVIARG